MKKIIIGLSGIVLVAFVVVMVPMLQQAIQRIQRRQLQKFQRIAASVRLQRLVLTRQKLKTAESKTLLRCCKKSCLCRVTAEAKKCDEAKPCAAKK